MLGEWHTKGELHPTVRDRGVVSIEPTTPVGIDVLNTTLGDRETS